MKRIIEWDLLTPEDVEVRVATTKNGKTTLLLYQDSRCAMRALDKQFGSFGWQMDYKVVGDQIYGTLSIYDEEKQMWVSKSDTGDKSNISEDKGQSSDILKRCAVRWGFARELYTTPKIVVDDDGYGCSGYKVSEINYDSNRNITHLVIANRFNKEVFRWEKGSVEQPTQYKPKSYTQTTQTDLEWKEEKKDNLTLLKEFYEQNKRNPNVNVEQLTKFKDYYKVKASEWRGDFNPSLMFERWMQRAA